MHARIGWQNLRTTEFLEDGKYLLITGTDFVDGKIDFTRCYYVKQERYNQDRNIQIKNGCILITKDGTLGKVAYVNGLNKPATLNAGIFNVEIRDENKVDRLYLYQYIKAPFLLEYVNQMATGGTIKHLNQNILVDFMVSMPQSMEQKKIGELFQILDHLITLHQSKSFGHILEVIVSCTLSWEQRKFGELFLEKRDKTEREDEDILLSCAITGIYLNSELFSHFRGTSNIGYLKIKKNDLILSAQNLHLGNANVNLLFEHGIISPAYKVYELNKCDQYFVQSWVKKDSTKDFFLNATTEGASQCRKNIDWCILNNQLITIPSLYEQIRIGKLFHCLNHLITLHQLEPFQMIFKAIAYRIIDYAKSKPPRRRKYTGLIAFIKHHV